jgi:hypothetical protein
MYFILFLISKNYIMDSMSNEMLMEILLKVSDLNDLLNFCRTSQSVNVICNDDYFWHRRFIQDYPHISNIIKPNGWSYFDLYKWVYSTELGSMILPFDNKLLSKRRINLIKLIPPYNFEKDTYKTFDGNTMDSYSIIPDITFVQRNNMWYQYNNPSRKIARFDPLRLGPRNSSPSSYKILSSAAFNGDEIVTQINNLLQEGYFILSGTIVDQIKYEKFLKSGLVQT